MRLREEQLQAAKRRVQAGEVDVTREVVSEEKTINVPVAHEEVVIERRPGSGQVDPVPPIGTEETIRVPVSAEQVEINKTPVVAEEIAVNKRTVGETEQYTETVKREEPRVTRQGDVDMRTDSTDVQTGDTGVPSSDTDLKDRDRGR
jgi:uncharacterized protein (TIGR02271 family)